MKRISLLLLSLLLVVLLASCASTKPFVEDLTWDEEIPLEEKFAHYGGTSVSVDYPEMYFYGPDWLDRMQELVAESHDYILISSYLGSYCESLKPLYDEIAKKAQDGVRIYYIYDGTSEEDMTDSRFVMTSLNYLRKYGVKVLSYSPLTFTHIFKPQTFLVRDHRKLMVFDGKVAVVGGMNTNYISMGAGDASQRDSMYVFHSPDLASLLTEEFTTIWNSSSVETLDASSFARYEDTTSSYRAWLFNRNVFEGKVSIAGMFGSLFAEAKDSIFLCPFLPILDKNMTKSFVSADEKGVDVTIFTSHDPRGYANKGFSYGVKHLVVDSHATVYDVTYDKEGTTLPLYHMKLMVVDDRYLVIGSSNFNFRSMALSHEIALVIDSPEIAEKAMEEAKRIGENPVLLTAEDAERMKREDGDFFCYLFTYFGG